MSSKTVQPIRRREQGETKSRRSARQKREKREKSRGKRKADVLPDRNGRKERVRKAVRRPRILIII